MRKTLFYALAILPALMVAGCDQTEDETPAEKPSIELGVTGNISVSRDGGEISIPYTISNPSDEGKISASVNEDVTWVNGFNYDTENTVVCHADENTQTQNRNAIVTLTYTYGSGESVTAQVNVIQEAAIAYDYTLEAESFTEKTANTTIIHGFPTCLSMTLEEPRSVAHTIFLTCMQAPPKVKTSLFRRQGHILSARLRLQLK